MKLVITGHAMKRFEERGAKFFKKGHCLNALVSDWKAGWKAGDALFAANSHKMRSLLRLATETKAFLNDTSYMVYLAEKYGVTDVPQFFELDSLIFVVRNQNMVVTVFNKVGK